MRTNAKEDLYLRVDKMREHLGITSYDTPVNTLELCYKENIRCQAHIPRF